MPTNVAKKNEFLFFVDKTPAMGGYRGAAGALRIIHGSKPFTQFSTQELQELANCIHTIILKGYGDENISNIFVSAKESFESPFELNLTPYPKCHCWEKLQGLIHYFFGGKEITNSQYRSVINFWNDRFNTKSILEDVSENFSPPLQPRKIDHFCDSKVIQEQLIAEYEGANTPKTLPSITSTADNNGDQNRYVLLVDKKPLGDHHTLVVNSGGQGHTESPIRLFQRLCIVQAQFKKFKELGDSNLHYVERFGNQLRGVPHTHSHAIGLRNAPASFKEKIIGLFRTYFPKALSDSQLVEKIEEYRKSLIHPSI